MDPVATARSLCAQLGVPNAPIARARDGREHHLFRVTLPQGERLLKFARADCLPDPYDPQRKPADRLRAEARAIGFVREVEVPTDYQIHETTPLCSTLGILPGTTAEILLEDKRLDESTLVTLCVQLGRTLAGIHGRRRPLVPEDAAALPDLPDVDPMNARLLHLDFHLGNVLIRPSISTGYAVSGVVDWTCARWGPPEADLVELQVSVFALNPRARDGFIAGYRKFAGRTFDLKDVERRATLEIQRRLVDDPPSDPVLARRWKDWVETR